MADTDVLPAGSGRIDIIDPDRFRVVSGITFGDSANDIALLSDGRLAVTDFVARAAVTVDRRSGRFRTLDLAGVGLARAADARTRRHLLRQRRGARTGRALIGVDGEGGFGSRFDLDFVPGRARCRPTATCSSSVIRPTGECIRYRSGRTRPTIPSTSTRASPTSPSSPDGLLLHVLGENGLWTLDATEHQPVGHPIAVSGHELALTPDGRRAAVVDGSADMVHLVDLSHVDPGDGRSGA